MNGKRIRIFFGAAVLCGLAGIGVRAHNAGQTLGQTGQQANDKAAPATGQGGAMSDEERTELMAKGKEIFVEKCAKCHNERGDKALSSGKPLNERGLETDAIARAVRGRLKDRTDEERHAVTLYIASLMKKN